MSAGLCVPEQSLIGSVPICLMLTASGHELCPLSGAQCRSCIGFGRAGLIVVDRHILVSHQVPRNRLVAWRSRARISRLLAMASWLSPPWCQLQFRFPKGAPARPPCSLDRPLRLLPIRLQGAPPPRVRAPHLGMAAKALVRSINGLVPPEGDSAEFHEIIP